MLLAQKKTIITIYPMGFDHGVVVYKHSHDYELGGIARLAMPSSWET